MVGSKLVARRERKAIGAATRQEIVSSGAKSPLWQCRQCQVLYERISPCTTTRAEERAISLYLKHCHTNPRLARNQFQLRNSDPCISSVTTLDHDYYWKGVF